MKRKSILLFDLAGPFFPGGCEKYFANLAKHLSRKQFVTIIESKGYFHFMNIIYFILTRRKMSSIKFVKRDIGNSSMFDFKLRSLIPFSTLYYTTKRQLVMSDQIYAKNEFQELAFLWFFLRNQYEKKVIVGVHSAIFVPNSVKGLWKKIHDIQYNGVLYRHLLRNAKKIHVNNSDYIKLLSSKYGVQNDKLVCVHNPIDWYTQFTPSTKGKFTIVWIGRLTEQKGIDRLKNILSYVNKSSVSIDIEFIVAGDGELKKEVEALDQKYKNVMYMGFLHDVQSLYKKADLSLFTAYFDTFAHAVLEPLSYGIPVISYDIPGPRDMIKNSENGYLVKNDEEFAKMIITQYRSYKDLKSYNNWRRLIYKSTNNKFSKTKTFKQIEKLFI